MNEERKILLEAEGIKKYFPVAGTLGKVVNHVKAVDDVLIRLYKGETMGLVGETGCGKSTLGRTLLKLTDPTAGKIYFDGEDITDYSESKMRLMRSKMQMVFQDPYTSLNPRKRVGQILEEVLSIHKICDRKDRMSVAMDTLRKVGLRPEHYYRYPHEFSGGQRQRLCIARALEVLPEVLICDEPVSALDVSIQAQVLNLMKEIQKDLNLTYLFIAHDLSVVQYMSDRIMVMYLGKIVEVADSRALYEEPLHPYTKALLSAIPIADIHTKKQRQILEGEVPSPIHKPSGCAFRNRCPHCMEICKTEDPALRYHGKEGHMVACHLYDGKESGDEA